MIRYTIFFLVLVVLGGCATVGSIETNYALIDYADGVDAREAVLIAKQHLINTEHRLRYRVIGPQVEDKSDEGAWLVRFYGKKTSISELYLPSVYEVRVDKKTGDCNVEYMSNVSEVHQ